MKIGDMKKKASVKMPDQPDQDERAGKAPTSPSEKASVARELFASYEEMDRLVEAAKIALESALQSRSDAVKAIAGFIGKEGLKRWKGRDGKERLGKIVCRSSGGGKGGTGEEDGAALKQTWFFKGLGGHEGVEDYG